MVYLTRQTLARLYRELDELLQRNALIASQIGDSRTSEKIRKNGEYNSAKDEQGLIEMRINSLRSSLQSVTLIESVERGIVCPGVIVDVVLSDGSEVERYLLASPDEPPPWPEVSVISPESPLARCLMGATAGESRTFRSNSQTIRVRVEGILPLPGLPTVDVTAGEGPPRTVSSPGKTPRPRRRS